MDKKKMLIIGASGLVGSYLYQTFLKDGNFEISGTYFGENHNPALKELDIRDEPLVQKLIKDFQPGIVILPAANPNVEYCETNPIETRAVNIDGAKNVIRNLPKNALFVYFSSDYVFDGEKGNYKENDKPNPINEYGRQKLEMEEEVKKVLPNYLIVRTTGIYGWHWGRKNYVMQVLDRIKKSEEISAPVDQIYCPTYAGNLAGALCSLIKQNQRGIFHITGKEAVNRLDFTKKIISSFNLNYEKIKGITTDKMQLKAKRPLKSDLNINKLESLGIKMFKVAEGLEKMKNDSFSVDYHRDYGANGV